MRARGIHTCLASMCVRILRAKASVSSHMQGCRYHACTRQAHGFCHAHLQSMQRLSAVNATIVCSRLWTIVALTAVNAKVVCSRLQTTFALTAVKTTLTVVNANVVCSRLRTTLTGLRNTTCFAEICFDWTKLSTSAGQLHDGGRQHVSCTTELQ